MFIKQINQGRLKDFDGKRGVNWKFLLVLSSKMNKVQALNVHNQASYFQRPFRNIALSNAQVLTQLLFSTDKLLRSTYCSQGRKTHSHRFLVRSYAAA